MRFSASSHFFCIYGLEDRRPKTGENLNFKIELNTINHFDLLAKY